MGLMVDTNVFIRFEKSGKPIDFSSWESSQKVYISAELAKKGQMIGAHDLIIAATARCHDLSVLTDNVQEFSRVPGLHVIQFVP